MTIIFFIHSRSGSIRVEHDTLLGLPLGLLLLLLTVSAEEDAHFLVFLAARA